MSKSKLENKLKSGITVKLKESENNFKMTETNIWKVFEKCNLEGYTLIIPSVAIGNVGQLTCDLLISSLKMNKIASIYSSALIPVIGYDPYDLKSNNLSSSCEVYKSDQKNLVVVQIRAPLIFNKSRQCLDNIIQWFKTKQIKNVIILTSSADHEKKSISSSPFRFVSSSPNLYENPLKSVDIMEHEIQNGDIKIYGGGFAGLISKICDECSVPWLIIFKYCSEGDNIPDAIKMISCLDQVHSIFEKKVDVSTQLVQPVSWKLLFGSPPPVDIY